MTTATQDESIRLMQKNVVSMAADNQTTEQRLTDIRASMRYYRPAQTFGRQHGRINGYYYTEPTDNRRV
jgi:transcriptional regulator with AAA-type ATPase domain